MKKQIISDPIYEAAIEATLQQVRGMLQNLIDTWNAAGLEPIQGTPGLYELIHNTAVPFAEAVAKLKEVPLGLTEKDVEKFLSSVVIPRDDKILSAAERCRKNPYCQRELSLFALNNGSVELSAKCQELIKKQSVYVTSESQQRFYNELKALIDELNRLNQASGNGLLKDNCRTLAPVFSSPDREQGGGTVGLNSEPLRELLKSL